MNDEVVETTDAVESAPAPEPEQDQPDVTPESFDRANRASDSPAEEPPAGEMPAPLADALEVPELAPPEHRLSDEVRDNLAQLASVGEREGMTLEDTQGLVSMYYELESTLGDLKVDQRDPDHQEKTLAHLRRTWGSQYKENLANAQKAFKGLSPATQAWINKTGAGDDASVLSILAAMGGGILKVPAAKAKELADEMRKNSPELLNTGHRDHHMAKLKYRLLRHVEARGDGDQSERASEARGKQAARDAVDTKAGKKADPARTKLEAEAKELRLSPAWHDKRDPAHKAVAARLSAIFAELYPSD